MSMSIFICIVNTTNSTIEDYGIVDFFFPFFPSFVNDQFDVAWELLPGMHALKFVVCVANESGV